LARYNDEQRKHVQKIAERLSIPFLDLTDQLILASKDVYPDLLYFPMNTHFSPAGHNEVARLVQSWMSARNSAQTGQKTEDSVARESETKARQ
jgi:lysophospholipase L1-like esterase